MDLPLPHTCPRCGQPMEAGFAAFSSALYWNYSPKALIGIRWSKRGDKMLTKIPFVSSNVPGFHCPTCKLVLIDYSSAA